MRTQFALLIARMFAGNIKKRTIISSQPVLVVDEGAVLNSFSEVQEAEKFLEIAHSDTAIIFKHDGSNWDIWQKTGPNENNP